MPSDALSATFSALAVSFRMTLPAVIKHPRILERAGPISKGRNAQGRPCP